MPHLAVVFRGKVRADDAVVAVDRAWARLNAPSEGGVGFQKRMVQRSRSARVRAYDDRA